MADALTGTMRIGWAQIDGPVPVATAWEDVDTPDGPARIPTAFDAGYHVNIPARFMVPQWDAYRVAPVPGTPERVFAGDAAPWPQTVFLRFSDAAEMVAVLGLPDGEGE